MSEVAQVSVPAPEAAQAMAETSAPSLLAYPATYLLIGINLAVYGLMFRYGPLPTVLRQHVAASGLTA